MPDTRKASDDRFSDGPGKYRLNRFIARSGYCSRREADSLIFDGKVRVNGHVEDNPAIRVTDEDEVEVNGSVLNRADHLYILLNKGRDTITSTDDDRGRKTVMDYLPRKLDSKGLFPVGRLDRNTEGILIITNDGELAHRLMHPSYEIQKVYRVTTDKPLSDKDIDALRSGIELDDGPARADKISKIHSEPGSVTAIEIHEGRNRQVRRMYEALGYHVVALERLYYAGLDVRGLRRGKWRHLENQEVKRLKKQVALKDSSSRSKGTRTT